MAWMITQPEDDVTVQDGDVGSAFVVEVDEGEAPAEYSWR